MVKRGSVKSVCELGVISSRPLSPVNPLRYRTLGGAETSRASIFSSPKEIALRSADTQKQLSGCFAAFQIDMRLGGFRKRIYLVNVQFQFALFKPVQHIVGAP